MKSLVAVGMMSGTSMDGIDAAVVRFLPSPPTTTPLPANYIPFHPPPESLPPLPYAGALLEGASETPYRPETLEALRMLASETPLPALAAVGLVTRTGIAVATDFAAAASQLAASCDIELEECVDLVASHGQTVFHHPPGAEVEEGGLLPEAYGTLQIGNSGVMAHTLQIPVVSDFRSNDMAVGGRGAPLIPYVDAVVFGDVGGEETRVLLNLGGIANISIISHSPSAPLLARDTGPANMVIDELAAHFSLGPRDENGKGAAAGTPDEGALAELLASIPYFDPSSPPNATGREMFGSRFVHETFLPALTTPHQPGTEYSEEYVANALATATLLTARTVARCIAHGVASLGDTGVPLRVISSGGGVQNPTLMAMLETEVIAALSPLSGGDDVSFTTASEFTGIDSFSDCKEAFGFAVLGAATWHRLPSNVMSATGATTHIVQGHVVYP